MIRAKLGMGRLRDPLRGHSPIAEGPFLMGQRAQLPNGARIVVANAAVPTATTQPV